VECTVEGKPQKQQIRLADDIPSNHKFARADIKAGQEIIKYGLCIGKASCDIRQGQYVHVHNIESNRCGGNVKAGK
jgi:altronate dehydratase small subunit